MNIRNTRNTPVRSIRKPIQASTSITSNVNSREQSRIMANFAGLNPQQRSFARQLHKNMTRTSSPIMGATNTSNIAARPDFLELLPMFVQKLILLDVYGSVAMNSRQQLIPYFKFVAENDKGETPAGKVLSSPFANRQGSDHNFTGRVVKNETPANIDDTTYALAYSPILPGSVTIVVNDEGTETPYFDDGNGNICDGSNEKKGYIDYSTGHIVSDTSNLFTETATLSVTYQYDNETVGPDPNGQYGAKMGKGYLQLDEINLIAEAHQLASYWSIYSAFAAQKEYGGNIADIAKEAAFSELTAEINAHGFAELDRAASFRPQFNWDATPILSGGVVPSDYLNMFKLKLGQAAASVYQATRLSRPNRLVVGSNVAEYIAMMNGFVADNVEDSVGPYHYGKLDNFEVYVDPNYDPNKWVMCCKSQDIRRNSALFGEYMPLTSTDAIGLANASVQQGYATMYGLKVVNPATVISGRIIGIF